MGKIFCLLGKSSVGKDTIFQILIQDKDLNLKPIITYTTRPKRDNEIDGVQYHFINKETLDNYSKMGKVIELREYDTVSGKWYYATIDDGIDLSKNNYLLIVTLEGFNNLKKCFGKDMVIPFYITIDDETRLLRAIEREKQQKNPNYNELCRRFIADNKDFHANKLKESGITKYYYNYNLSECYMNIKSDILKQINN